MDQKRLLGVPGDAPERTTARVGTVEGDSADDPGGQLRDLFARCVDLPEAERAIFLSEMKRRHPELHASLVSLVNADGVGTLAVRADIERAIVNGLIGTGDRPGQRLGPYRLVEAIGAGGMGAVFSAVRVDGEFEKRVAIKMMRANLTSDALRARFLRERQILAELEHPHIARLLDGGTASDGTPYLVMEYIQGLPITEHCNTKQLSMWDRLELLEQACEAVDHAHRRNFIHRDLKPGNILVGEGGVVKLLDFGIAKLLEATGKEVEAGPGVRRPYSDLTAPDERPMTPRYASPEQLRGAPTTRETDVYSLGVLAYEMLTGELPRKLVETSDTTSSHPSDLDPLVPIPPSARGQRNRRLRGMNKGSTR